MIHYLSVNGLVQTAVLQNCRISDLVLAQQAEQLEQTPEKVYETMAQSLSVMRQAVIDGTYPDLRSTSGLTGGAAFKMKCSVDDGKNICGKMFGSAMVKALAVSELNAAMGKIVAAPTAGSCGIIPAAVLTMQEEHRISDDTAVRALFTASAIGMVIAQKRQYFWCGRWLSGRMRQRVGNGCCCFGGDGGRHTAAGIACLCDCAEKYTGIGLRSGSGIGGNSLYQA